MHFTSALELYDYLLGTNKLVNCSREKDPSSQKVEISAIPIGLELGGTDLVIADLVKRNLPLQQGM